MQNSTNKKRLTIGIISVCLIAVVIFIIYLLRKKPFTRITGPFPLILNPSFNLSLQRYIQTIPVTEIFAVTGSAKSGKSYLLKELEKNALTNHHIPLLLDFKNSKSPHFLEDFHLKLATILSSISLTPNQIEQLALFTFPPENKVIPPKFSITGLDAIYVTIADAFDEFYHNDILNKSEKSGIVRFLKVVARYRMIFHPLLLLNNAEYLVYNSNDPKMMKLKINTFLADLSQYAIYTPIVAEVHNSTLLFESNYSTEFLAPSISPIENPANVLQKLSIFTKSESEKLVNAFKGNMYPFSRVFSEKEYSNSLSALSVSIIYKETKEIERIVNKYFKDPSNPLWEALINGPVVINSINELHNLQKLIDQGLLILQKIKGQWELSISDPTVLQQITLLHKQPRTTPKPTIKPQMTPIVNRHNQHTHHGHHAHHDNQMNLDQINETINDPNCVNNNQSEIIIDENVTVDVNLNTTDEQNQTNNLPEKNVSSNINKTQQLRNKKTNKEL